jgi:hypothetical protein
VETAFVSMLRVATALGHRPELEIRKAELGKAAAMIGPADLARRATRD